jgi:Integrase core domain
MSRPRGNPYDNTTCESFLKTLKYEEVYRQEYRDLAEARASIERFLEKVYNKTAPFGPGLSSDEFFGECAGALLAELPWPSSSQ